MTRIIRNNSTTPSTSLQDRIKIFNKTAPRAKPRSVESPIQIACVRWFHAQYPTLRGVFFAVPNGGRRNVVTARILAAEGTLAGVSDLILLAPSSDAEYHGLCIEMKTTAAGSRQSEVQQEFQRAVEMQGYKYVICRSVEEFITQIDEYLK